MRLMMRTYNLLDFVKKFLRRIETALKSVGIPFITKYCLEKYCSFAQQSPVKKPTHKSLLNEKNEIIQIPCFKKQSALNALQTL